MVNLSYLAEHRIGPRSFLKSYRTYRRSRAGKGWKGLTRFLLNGNLDVSIGRNAVIENSGFFCFGIKNTCEPSTVAGSLHLRKNSKLILNGRVTVGPGARLEVEEQAVLEINDSYVNSNTKIVCAKHIRISKALIGEDVMIMDSDCHGIMPGDFETSRPIVIGSNVWIGSRAIILKGVTVGSGSVIGCGAVVTRDVPEDCLAVGVPAKVVRESIKWNAREVTVPPILF